MAHYHYLAKKLAIYHNFGNIEGSTTFFTLKFVKFEFQKLEFSEKFWNSNFTEKF